MEKKERKSSTAVNCKQVNDIDGVCRLKRQPIVKNSVEIDVVGVGGKCWWTLLIMKRNAREMFSLQKFRLRKCFRLHEGFEIQINFPKWKHNSIQEWS